MIWAQPDHGEARELAAAAHTQMGYAAENATWRNAYLSAAQELRNGLPEAKKNHRILGDASVVSNLPDLLDHFPAWFPIATHDLKFEEKEGDE